MSDSLAATTNFILGIEDNFTSHVIKWHYDILKQKKVQSSTCHLKHNPEPLISTLIIVLCKLDKGTHFYFNDENGAKLHTRSLMYRLHT